MSNLPESSSIDTSSRSPGTSSERAVPKASTSNKKSIHSFDVPHFVRSDSSFSPIVRACGAILLILLCCNMFVILQGDVENRFTFSRLLEIFSNVPNLKIEDWKIPVIREDWSIFNFLRDFLNNFFVAPLNVVLFLIGGISTLVVFVGYFLGFIFLA